MRPLLDLNSDELLQLGIREWGYTEVSTPISYERFQDWLKDSEISYLPYLKDHRAELRRDIRKVFPAFQSALVFHFSYAEIKKYLLENNQHNLAAYSLGFDGLDYHDVLQERLEIVINYIQEQYPDVIIKKSIDVLPVLERDLSFRAGLGWFGKNSMLISREEGSYFIIASLLLSQKLPLAQLDFETDHCGQCQLCIEACPTQAINPETRTLLTDKCLSTITIEVRQPVPFPEGAEKSRGEIFGCDICQDVCPWNKKKLSKTVAQTPTAQAKKWLDFFSRNKLEILQEISQWSGKAYERFFHKSVFSRPTLKGMMKNLRF